MRLRSWLKAARPPSLSYIWPPLLLGQVLAGRPLAPGAMVLALGFGLFDQLTIVMANDWADRETDAQNTTYTAFSGGSRVLVEGALRPDDLRRAYRASGLLGAVCALALALWYGAWAALPLCAGAYLLLWMYSFPPVRLSYRGGGEVLQMLGVGLVLPLFGFVAQGGRIGEFPWQLTAALLPTHLACALATALPDAPSDAASGKLTAAVRWGQGPIRVAIFGLNLVAVIALAGLGGELGPPVALVPALANLAALAPRGGPGSRALSVAVFFSILTTLGVVCGLIVVAWG